MKGAPMSDITPIRPEGEFTEDPLENLLDEESDEDFGYVVTRDRANGPDGHPVKLAEWSAQDFASIYTRFRPHLERHARRFLSNPSQVDEVVQDAFLYLMVSLPELDSEIGVLRFLKWKTRLLCLDVIRASGKAYVSNLDDVAEPVSQDPEVSSYLEQQDDAAVLRLALSKLSPRHREVLLASIYEEKSTDQIAAQVGLSENATRQLIFRARAAFKKALLGDDVNTSGMSAAAILSVAARKAAMEAKKVGAQAMVFVLFLMLAVGAFVNFTGRGTQTQEVAQQGTETQAPSGQTSSETPVQSYATESVQIDNNPANGTVVASPVTNSQSSAEPSPSASPFTAAAEAKVMNSRDSEVYFVRKSSLPDPLGQSLSGEYVASASQGIYSEFTFNYYAAKQFSGVKVYFLIDEKPYLAATTLTEVVSGVDQFGLEHIVYYGAVDYLVDKNGAAVETAKISQGTMRIELVLNKDKTAVVSTSLDVLEK
jgi:RNA polymerase sigma-70 factor (ECF subfamily)